MRPLIKKITSAAGQPQSFRQAITRGFQNRPTWLLILDRLSSGKVVAIRYHVVIFTEVNRYVSCRLRINCNLENDIGLQLNSQNKYLTIPLIDSNALA